MRHFEYQDPRLKLTNQPGTHERNLGLAICLEFILGVFQIFGVGHLYAGNWKTGISIMTSYWFALMANIILVPFGIGILSGPVTWLIFLGLTIYYVIEYARSKPDQFA